MRALRRAVRRRALQRRALALAALWTASACSTSGPVRPETTEVRNESGFTLTQEVHVGADVRADFETAVRRLEQEEYDEGIALLVEVTKAAPDLASAHLNLGIAYRRAGDLERAEGSLRRALELSPRHPVAHNELGIVQRRSGRFEEARESYEKALEGWPEFHFARRNLAILCDVYLGDADCALEHYQRYVEAVPGDEAAAVWIADLRARAGKE